jgi:hypothetical protein
VTHGVDSRVHGSDAADSELGFPVLLKVGMLHVLRMYFVEFIDFLSITLLYAVPPCQGFSETGDRYTRVPIARMLIH